MSETARLKLVSKGQVQMRVAPIVTALTLAFVAGSSAAAQSNPASLCPATSGRLHAPLSQVTLYSGPVADDASLAPDSSTTEHGITTNTWPLAGEGRITIICLYGAKARAITSHPPAGATVCTERLRLVRALPGYKPIDIVCR